MLLDDATAMVKDSKTILAFETEGGDRWPAWNRYITIDGKRAYEIGNICGTCAFYFERLEGANKSISPKSAISALNAGVLGLNKDLIKNVSTVFPDGEYKILLSEVAPKLVRPGEPDDYFVNEQVDHWGVDPFWHLPHFPNTEYYRLGKKLFAEASCLFEFLIPTFPHNWLDEQTVKTYERAYRDGAKPTAVALSVLDIKQPEEGDENFHWCLANYLIDGHHKAYAAACSQSSMTLMSFLAIDKGVSTPNDIGELVREVLPKT